MDKGACYWQTGYLSTVARQAQNLFHAACKSDETFFPLALYGIRRRGSEGPVLLAYNILLVRRIGYALEAQSAIVLKAELAS